MSIVKSLSVGDGDMFYILHGADSFTIIDCCLSDEDRVRIVNELLSKSADKGVHRFISTHPDDDHIRGITFLHNYMPIVNFYCVENKATKKEKDMTDDFRQYCAFRDDPQKAFYLVKGCSRKWLNEDSDQQDSVKRDGAGIHIHWPVTTNEHYQAALAVAKDGGNPNNICPIITYSLNNGATIMWMGDLETDFMNEIGKVINMPRVHVLFAPHHGRKTGRVPTDWLKQMQPKLIVVGEAPSEHLTYYKDYHTITQNTAGDITFDCVEGRVHTYVSGRYYSVDFLNDERMGNNYGGYYIGTLEL